MLALAIVIALMGVANTLGLSIRERTRELGRLHAVGQQRRQARSMICWEPVIISVFGTVGGVALGTFLGWAVVASASSSTLGVFAAPPGQLAIFLVAGALADVLAAISILKPWGPTARGRRHASQRAHPAPVRERSTA